MVEEILPAIYRIRVPLPRNPLKELNAYVIKGTKRSLLIDTGMNREECREALFAGLAKLGLNPGELDVFVTHHHADHLGLVGTLTAAGASPIINRIELETVGTEENWQAMVRYFACNGFPPTELYAALDSHPGRRYQLRQPVVFQFVEENTLIEVGQYRFHCIVTPGHSPAHTCLYEPNSRILVSGDHILFDITPNISQPSLSLNPLKNYLANLDKVYMLDVSLVLPGHRELSTNHRARIDELKRHHQARADEVLHALTNGKLTAFEVASRISWDIDCESWDQFPPRQKWFALGETLAHLKYLEDEGRVLRTTHNGIYTFSTVN